ncbi:MAG: HAD family hydrolase, partial [Thermomicrobiales bacterium]
MTDADDRQQQHSANRRELIGGAAAIAAATLAAALPAAASANDPLPSWNAGVNKQAILDFVAAVTTEGGPDFVPEADRIAVFDNDGTLWAEQPAYSQAFFVLDQIGKMAGAHPEWSTTEPYASVLSGDPARLAGLSEHDLGQVISTASTGMSVDDFAASVGEWIATATHPVLKVPYRQTTYQPQLELLDYLEANGFDTWIVSGGGIDFMRVFSEAFYGIPSERTVGSSTELKYEVIDGNPTLIKQPKLGVYDDKEGKPINIHLAIGKRPILAVGNSDGDRQMLEYTAGGDGPSLM